MKQAFVNSQQRITAILNKEPMRFWWGNGRLLTAAIVSIYVFQLVSYSRIGDYEYIWGKLGVPAMLQRHFSDLLSVLSAFQCTRLGYNVLISNPCDGLWPNLNYPLIWMKLAPLGLGQSDTVWLGIVLGVVFIIAALLVARPLNLAEGLIYGAILISPSVMLGVERGNVDLILFILLCLALLILDHARFGYIRCIAYSLIYLTVLLKLYPVFGFAVILREKTKACLAALAVFGAASLGYLLSDLNQFRLVYSFYPQTTVYSFGRSVLIKLLSDLNGSVNLPGVSQTSPAQEWVSISAMICVGVLAFATAWRSWSLGNPASDYEGWRLDCFRVGAAIYIGCFALGYNYDYRLIFTILTVPLMLDWLKNATGLLQGLGGSALACLVLTLWLSRWSTVFVFFSLPDRYFFPDEFLNWFLLFFYFFGLFITLPGWVRPLFAMRSFEGRQANNSNGSFSTP